MTAKILQTAMYALELFHDQKVEEYKRTDFSGDSYNLVVASATIIPYEDAPKLEVLIQKFGTVFRGTRIMINGFCSTEKCLQELENVTGDVWEEQDLEMLKDVLIDPVTTLEKWCQTEVMFLKDSGLFFETGACEECECEEGEEEGDCECEECECEECECECEEGEECECEEGEEEGDCECEECECEEEGEEECECEEGEEEGECKESGMFFW